GFEEFDKTFEKIDVDDELKLLELINDLPTNETNDHLTAFDYIHAENEEVNEGLTEEEILEIVKSKDKEEEEEEQREDLVEEGPEFRNVEEVKVLRKLYKR
ncbi:21982_t:CDS:2, partial [Racocetra persica]